MNVNIFRKISTYAVFLMFSTSIALCFVSISELDSREQLMRSIEKDLEDAHSDLGRILNNRDFIGEERAKSELASKIAIISSTQDRLTVLENFIAVGSWDDQIHLKTIAAGNSFTFFYNKAKNNGETINIPILSQVLNTIRLMSNDSIIALLIMLCSFVGSSVTSIRGSGVNMKTLLLGVAAGLLVYLFAKGGLISIFQANSNAQSYPLNPYSISFLSIVAGLYSEKLFYLLGIISNRWTEKIEKE